METLANKMEKQAQNVASILKNVANPERLMILCILSQNKMTVGELEGQVNLSQSALSQHLAKLRNAKMVGAERQGKFIYYEISDPKIMRLFETLYELYCPKEND
jgi:ArsR family transcriptional regulator